MLPILLTLALAEGPLIFVGGPPEQVRPLLLQLAGDPDLRLVDAAPCTTLECVRQRVAFADLGVFLQTAPAEVLVVDSTGAVARRVPIDGDLHAAVRAALELPAPRPVAATPERVTPGRTTPEPAGAPPPPPQAQDGSCDPLVLAVSAAGAACALAGGVCVVVSAADGGDCTPNCSSGCTPNLSCSPNCSGACVSALPLGPAPELPSRPVAEGAGMAF